MHADRGLRIGLPRNGNFSLPGGFWYSCLLLSSRPDAHGRNGPRQYSILREEPKGNHPPQRTSRAPDLLHGHRVVRAQNASDFPGRRQCGESFRCCHAHREARCQAPDLDHCDARAGGHGCGAGGQSESRWAKGHDCFPTHVPHRRLRSGGL